MTSDWMFHCYILHCADGSYYCGHTDDIDRRIAEHQTGFYPGYTFKRRPVRLVWNDTFQSRDDAKAAEKKIKGWSRAKKEALINRDWSLISQLSKNYSQHGPRKP